MRPRPMTAENSGAPGAWIADGGCRFNEAAADDRGKRGSPTSIPRGWPTSLQ